MRATLLISLASLVVALLLGEGYLRLAGHGPRPHWVNANFDGTGWGLEDAAFGWVNRPGVHRSVEAGQVPMTFLPDHTRASRADGAPEGGTGAGGMGAGSALLVGCSFTQGYGVADAETYAWRLAERFPDLKVENFGTGGYSAHQAYLRLKAELDRRRDDPPKAVVFGLIAHQLPRTVAAAEWVRYLTDRNGDMLAPPHVTLDGQGRLVDHPMELIGPWPLEDRSALVATLHRAALGARFGGRLEQALPATVATVERMAALARERGVPFAVALLDNLHAPGGAETWTRLVAALDRAGAPVLNCVHPDYERDPPSLQVGGGGHPNGIVHRHWADCIAPWLASATGVGR